MLVCFLKCFDFVVTWYQGDLGFEILFLLVQSQPLVTVICAESEERLLHVKPLTNLLFNIFKYTFYVFFFLFYFIFKLYKIVLVLPNIKMNPPEVYMCSPS